MIQETVTELEKVCIKICQLDPEHTLEYKMCIDLIITFLIANKNKNLN